MKKMKRVLVALLSCLTAFACLAGTVACGDDKKTNDVPNNNVSTSTDDASKDDNASNDKEEAKPVGGCNGECNFEYVAAIYPTCTEDGRAETVKCTKCGYVVDPAPALFEKSAYVCEAEYEAAKEAYLEYWSEWARLGNEDHVWGDATEAIPADCCNDGVKSYSTCTVCGVKGIAGKVVEDIVDYAKGDHTYVDFTHAIPATCTTDGRTEGWVCENGGSKESEFVAAFGHNSDFEAEDFAGVAPTCTTNGFCWCGAELEGTALGHDMVPVDAKIATCAENGWEAFEYCVNCEHTTFDFEKADAMTAKAHWTEQLNAENFTEVAAVVATCTEAGNSKYFVCGECNLIRSSKTNTADVYEVLEESRLYIEMKAHVLDTRLDDYTAKVAATCEVDGQEACGTCKNCEQYITGDVIEALGHNFETNGGKAATCTTNAVCGNKSACDYFEKGKAELADTAIGHDWVPVDTVYETCEIDGIRAHYECANCAAWAMENAEENEKKNDGCIDGYNEKATAASYVIEAQGHGYLNNWVKVEAQAATHAEAGWNEYYVCGQCDDQLAVKSGSRFVEIDEIPVVDALVGHNCPDNNILTCSRYFVCEDIVVVNEETGEETITHYGCGKVYANTNFKPCVDADEDGICEVCGKKACEHDNSENGLCLDCGYCAHKSHNSIGACAVCGVVVGHNYEFDGISTFACECGEVCPHNVHIDNDFTCETCGNEIEGETHDYSNGDYVCVECGKGCAHKDGYDVDNKCNTCGQPCAHEAHDFETELCTVCGASKAHDWALQEDGSRYCKFCEVTCEHELHAEVAGDDVNGLCDVCGYAVAHDYELAEKDELPNGKIYVYCKNIRCAHAIEYKEVCLHQVGHTKDLVCKDCCGDATNGVVHTYVLNNNMVTCSECNVAAQYLNNITKNGTLNIEYYNQTENSAIVVAGDTVVTIVGGEYSSIEGTIIEVKDSAKVVIEGGVFYLTEEDAVTDDMLIGNVEVKGGTFYGYKPTVASGYVAVGQMEIEAGVFEYYTVEKAE